MSQLNTRLPARNSRQRQGNGLTDMELRAAKQIAHRVVDQLTAVSGYSQLAMQRRSAQLGVCAELKKIRRSADKAVALVRLALVHLSHLEGLQG